MTSAEGSSRYIDPLRVASHLGNFHGNLLSCGLPVRLGEHMHTLALSEIMPLVYDIDFVVHCLQKHKVTLLYDFIPLKNRKD